MCLTCLPKSCWWDLQKQLYSKQGSKRRWWKSNVCYNYAREYQVGQITLKFTLCVSLLLCTAFTHKKREKTTSFSKTFIIETFERFDNTTDDVQQHTMTASCLRAKTELFKPIKMFSFSRKWPTSINESSRVWFKMARNTLGLGNDPQIYHVM